MKGVVRVRRSCRGAGERRELSTLGESQPLGLLILQLSAPEQ